MDIAPPDSLHWRHSPNYCLRLTDCQAYGSRWVISLDDKLRLGMMKNDPAATSLWQRVVALFRFIKEHEQWGQSVGGRNL